MKKILILLFIICVVNQMQAQTSYDKLIYSYDMNGNRDNRQKTLVILSKMGNPEVIKLDKSDSTSNEIPSLLKVFPNPTSNFINICLTTANNESIQSIKLFDMKGSVILEKFELTLSNSIDLNSYHAGIYLLLVEINNKIYKYQILKVTQ